MPKKILPFLFSVLFFAAAARAEDPVISPKIPSIKTDKLVFTFSKEMVGLGTTERAAEDIPVVFIPTVACQWRWLDQKNLACFLNKETRLVADRDYHVTVGEFETLSGVKTQAYDKTFRTAPVSVNVSRSTFRNFANPRRPVWEVVFSDEVDAAEQQPFFDFDGTAAVVTAKKCPAWEDDCANKVIVEAAEDLAENKPYALSYKDQVVFKGQTLPPIGVEGIRCYNGEDFIVFPAGQKASCAHGYGIWVKMTDEVPQGEIADFVDKAENSPVVSDLIPLSLGSGERTVTVRKGLIDRWGASLPEDVELAVSVSDREPEIKTSYDAAVLEADEKTDMTGWAQNLTALSVDYKGFTADGILEGKKAVAGLLPDVRNKAYAFDYDIRAMTDGRSGFVAGKFAAEPNIRYLQPFYAVVSPWQIVVKFGYESSLVWVVDLKTGKPVKKAEVEIGVRKIADPAAVRISAAARTDGDGLATFAGLKVLDPENKLTSVWKHEDERLFVTVRKGKEIAVLPVGYDFKNYTNSVTGWNGENDRFRPAAFGMTPQNIYRRGETVDYKIWLRGEGLAKAPFRTCDLTVSDPEGQTVSERKNVELSPFGTIEGSFKIGDTAPTGDYTVTLTANGTSFSPLIVPVSDFTALPFKAETEIAENRLSGGSETLFRSSAALQSGGAFVSAPVRQTAVLSHMSFEYEDFRFHSPETPYEVLLDRKILTDGDGTATAAVVLPVSDKETGKIVFETRVFGDDGRFATAARSVPYFARDKLVGVKPEKWVVRAKRETKPAVIVVSPDKKPVAGGKIDVEILYNDNKLIREKAAGNAYILRYEKNPVPVASCALTAAGKPVFCPFTPEKAGSYTVRAASDGSTAEASFYVEGDGYVPWSSNDDDSLIVTADKKSYEPDETATILIENPFPKAQLLLTVERDRILKTITKKVSNGTVKIKLKIDKDFFPGVYVSAKLFSPRVKAKKADEPDLGKPAERTGYLKLPVSDPSKIMRLTVTADKEKYRPREKAKISISADEKRPVEAAVVVLDEAMLALLPNGDAAFDPVPALSGLRDLDVKTYSLIKQLIGRQNIEKKGANQGGDGGSGFTVRDLFKMVGYWNPSVRLDAEGKAEIEVPLPDNLTRWRVIAVAAPAEGGIGRAQTSFVVSQPLEMRALLPNHLRDGDLFIPAVSVLNRTDQTLDAVITLKNVRKTETLAPFERKTVSFPVISTGGSDNLSLLFTAEAGKETDALRVDLPVFPIFRTETSSLSGQIENDTLSVPIDAPDNSRLDLSLSLSVESAMELAVKMMKTYPFGCWEQRISRAWAAVSAGEMWKDGTDFVQKTLAESESFQTSNGGMTYFSNYDGFENPYLSAYTSFVFAALDEEGFDVPEKTAEKLERYLLGLFRGREKTKEATTIRALSVPFLMKRNALRDADLDALRRDAKKMTPFAKAVVYPYLRTDPVANADISTGSVTVSEPKGQNYSVLPSAAKANCAALYALPDNAALMRGVLGLRGKDGTWGSTHNNAFCLAALRRRIEKAETGEPAEVSVKIGKQTVLDVPVSKQPLFVSHDLEKDGKTTLSFEKKGNGKPYWTASFDYIPPTTGAVNAGFEVARSFELKTDDGFVPAKRFKRGDTVRVKLTLTVPSFKSFVVLSDPLAGTLEPVSKDLDEEAAFYHADITHSSADFFAEALNAGTYEVSYEAQVTAEGEFTAPPAKAEEMYHPAVFGLSAPDRLITAQ